MIKSEFAEWIRQMLFPVQVFQGVGHGSNYYRERTNTSLRVGGIVMTAAAGAWTDIVRWHRARRAIVHLHSCSDHILRDIGIDRSQITSAVQFGDAIKRRGSGN